MPGEKLVQHKKCIAVITKQFFGKWFQLRIIREPLQLNADCLFAEECLWVHLYSTDSCSWFSAYLEWGDHRIILINHV